MRGELGRVSSVALAFALAITACAKKGKDDTARSDYPSVPESKLKGVVRTTLDSPKPTSAQLERRRRSEEAVKRLGLPIMEGLPVVEDDAKVKPRTQDEVVGRCLATTFSAVKGETNDQKLVDKLLADFAALPELSPEERAFIQRPSPSKEELVNFSWRYECMHVFLWALGYLPELSPPDVQSNVAKEAGVIREKGRAAFQKNAKLRPLREILDQSDYYYRLHWAVIELRLKGQSNPKANEEIIDERHRALNWLIRYMDQAWDDVSTDT